MNVLVTGATGFIGCHVVTALLAKGHRVTAVARNPQRASQSPWYGRATFLAADIHAPGCAERLEPSQFDAVMHLAWPGLPNYAALTHLDRTLPDECRFLGDLVRLGTRQLLVSGTCFEYGLVSGGLAETTPPQPVTAYGMAKNTLRGYLELLQKAHPFRLQWARLFYMHGPGQNPKSLLPQLDKALTEGQPVFNLSGGEQLRDYLPVEEVATRLVALLAHPGFDGVINICSGQPVSVRRLVEGHVTAVGGSIRFNFGHYPYPDYEPMAFWGDTRKFQNLYRSPMQSVECDGTNEPQNEVFARDLSIHENER